MSPPLPPSLLARDREQLDRVARLLGDGRRGLAVLVCAAALRPEAIRYLVEKSGKAVPEPRVIAVPEAMVSALGAIDGKAAEAVDSIAVEAASVDVWTALNWHREKLRRGGQVLLWLESIEGLRALREHAPDAYSFRDSVVIVEGESAPPLQWEGEEPADVQTARLLFELPRLPEERAEAAVELARTLRLRGRSGEAGRVAREGLALIPRERYSASRHSEMRAQMYQALMAAANGAGRNIDVSRFCRLGMKELDGRSDRNATELRKWFELMASSRGPLRADRALTERCLQSITAETQSSLIMTIRACAAKSALERGRFAAALRHNEQNQSAPQMTLVERGDICQELGSIHRETGRFELASADLEAAKELFLRASHVETWTSRRQAQLLIDKGEISAAETLLRHVSEDPRLVPDEPSLRASLQDAGQRHRGDVRGAMGTVVRCVVEAVADLRDSSAYGDSVHLVGLLWQVRDVAANESDRTRALEVIDSAARALIEAAGDDPPWYKVLFPGLRASLLSLFGTRHDEALAAASEAVALARRLWKQALPITTRTLVQCLARAGRWSEMEPAVADALQCARDDDHLRELALVQAHELARLVILRSPREATGGALAALRGTFSEMDAPRVEGETWLEVAAYLPPLATHPDLIEIADRAHALFLDMPMPEPVARCLEWLGDIYQARGDRSHAENCYRMSLATLDRYELLLRKALLQTKLARCTIRQNAG